MPIAVTERKETVVGKDYEASSRLGGCISSPKRFRRWFWRLLPFVPLLFCLYVIGALVYPPEAVRKTVVCLERLQIACEYYRKDCGRYPAIRLGLRALVEDPGDHGWRGPYVEEIPKDAWGMEFHYAIDPVPSPRPLVMSAGSDRVFGTGDDIYGLYQGEIIPGNLAPARPTDGRAR